MVAGSACPGVAVRACRGRLGHVMLELGMPTWPSQGDSTGVVYHWGWCVSVGAGSSRRDRQDCGDRLPGARGVLAESVGNMCMAWEGRSALCWIAPSCIEPRDDALHARPHHGGRREGTEGGNLGREGRMRYLGWEHAWAGRVGGEEGCVCLPPYDAFTCTTT